MPKMSITKCSPSPNDIFLLDTNILIHLFYPTLSNTYMKEYENWYGRSIRNNSKFILPAVQLSEFVNRCIRFQFDLYAGKECSNSFDFKRDYRGTDDYRNCMNAILDIINQDILKNFQPVDDCFNSIDLKNLLCYGFSYDFNDALLVQIAEKHHASIVTHDVDFANYKTTQLILTDNKKLLMFS